MNFIILAGGSGTRLWPLSRKNYPKQFMKLNHNMDSFFQQTVERVIRFAKDTGQSVSLCIITNQKYNFFVQSQLNEVLQRLKTSINIAMVFEPVNKDTAPAITLAIRKFIESGISMDEVVVVLSSDHVITPQDKFNEAILNAVENAKSGAIVTFGIKPDKPETGYGYIEIGERINETAFKVISFKEKPDLKQAIEYVQSEKYFWNSGMFCFTVKTFIDELTKYSPKIAEILTCNDYESYFESEVPCISIDYALMEKTDKIVLIPATFKWCDMGSWESIYEMYDKDKNKNICFGEVLMLDTKNSLVVGNGRLTALVGVNDLIVVETPDAVLITKKGQGQKIKQLVNMLKSQKSKSKLVDEHITDYRPWGNFTLLETGLRYKIKKIIVNPGEKLSLQMHHHRSEHWIVVKGTAKVIIGDKEMFVHENESVYVPKSTVHRLENPGKIPLELIEVQVGEYLEENDIKRFDDIYGR